MPHKGLIKSAIATILINYAIAHCNANQSNSIQTPSRGLSSDASPITGELIKTQKIVTGDKFSSADSDENNREFPPSERRKRNIDNDYDYGISAASGDADSLPECILSRSEFYLAWWVHENGTLKLPASNRSGKYTGFADLSVKLASEDLLIKQVTEMTTDNPNDVRIFPKLSISRRVTVL
jgi:hypothetical protein